MKSKLLGAFENLTEQLEKEGGGGHVAEIGEDFLEERVNKPMFRKVVQVGYT